MRPKRKTDHKAIIFYRSFVFIFLLIRFLGTEIVKINGKLKRRFSLNPAGGSDYRYNLSFDRFKLHAIAS